MSKYGAVRTVVDGVTFASAPRPGPKPAGPTEAAERYWAKVDRRGPEECWPWKQTSRMSSGYGAVQFDMGSGPRNYGAHRVAFYLANGRPQALGLHVMHACDNKACCNPGHLSEGSRSENMRDAYARGRRVPNPPTGERHHRALLTEAQVLVVRRLFSMGAKRADLATLAGVSLGTIDNITARRNWRAVA